LNELRDLGWSASWEEHFQPFNEAGLEPARVFSEHRDRYGVLTRRGEQSARISGRLRHLGELGEELPTVGDWVVVRHHPEKSAHDGDDGHGDDGHGGDGDGGDGDGRDDRGGDCDGRDDRTSRTDGSTIIHAVLPRHSVLTRKRPDGRKIGCRTDAQVLAANLDVVFLVSALTRDFNLRRIERLLATVWESGARPVLLLNKADICEDVDGLRARAETVAIGVPIHVLSALDGSGVEAVAAYLDRGTTIALVGSSGVGKSTLLNRLAGDQLMEIREIRESDGRGRHTTTHRQLFRLASGGLLIDTPGVRQFGLWSAEEGLDTTFADVETLAAGCRFGDCQHQGEPGCAVRRALESGELEAGRYQSYLKLQREQAYMRRQQDHLERMKECQRWKRITMSHRRRKRSQQRDQHP
jgi:ribosome biogenesis GTPase